MVISVRYSYINLFHEYIPFSEIHIERKEYIQYLIKIISFHKRKEGATTRDKLAWRAV